MTRILKNSILFILLLSSFGLQAQKCANNYRDSIMLIDNPNLLEERYDRIRTIQKNSGTKTSFTDNIIYIPVVVHVIHTSEDGSISDDPNLGNISDEQIMSQIEVLNQDFRKKFGTPGFNNKIVGADMMIEFCLADIDPAGKPTNGITRNYAPKRVYDAFSDDREIKSIVQWSTDQYLNIYTVPVLSDNFLGYATFPQQPRGWDGIVMANRFFGNQIGTAEFGFPYNKGRTLTHEVGHWLGLLHIWGDGGCGVDDFCDDTPESDDGNYGCDTTHISCGSLDMVRNYMDYSDDDCFNIFTQCQRDIARSIFDVKTPNNRASFVSTSTLNNPKCLDIPDSVVNDVPENEITIGTIDARLGFYGIYGLASNREYKMALFDSRGRKIESYSRISDNNGILFISLNDKRQGIYFLQVISDNGSFNNFKLNGPLK